MYIFISITLLIILVRSTKMKEEIDKWNKKSGSALTRCDKRWRFCNITRFLCLWKNRSDLEHLGAEARHCIYAAKFYTFFTCKKSASALLNHEGHWKTDEEARPKQVRSCVGIYMEYFSVLPPQEA